jgi:hypothetical protein
VPESSITCGLEDALSLIVTVPDLAPCGFGEKVTLIGTYELLPVDTDHVKCLALARSGSK